MATALLRLRTPASGVEVSTSETALAWGLNGADHIKTDSKRVLALVFRIENLSSTTALNSLKVYGKVHPDDDTWVPLATGKADYTAGNAYVRDARVFDSNDAFVDKDLASIGAGEYGLLLLFVPGFSQVKVTATVASGTADVAAFVQGVDAMPTDAASSLLNAVAPAAATPQDALTATNSWKKVSLTPGTEYIAAYTDEDVYLVPSASSSSPSSNGARFHGGATHLVRCRGASYLHYLRAGANDATVEYTEFGN